MIIETIVSTIDENGQPNFAPMGIVWGEETVMVRPYKNTHTARNFLNTGYGVANLTDDVSAFVRTCLYDAVLPGFPAKTIPGIVLETACSWLELSVVSHNEDRDCCELLCRVLYRGKQSEFLGFCRARNAVIEAAILASRVHLWDPAELMSVLTPLGEIVKKTGSEYEIDAFRLVSEYVQKKEDR
jgi:uncharacterized protein